MSKTSEEINHTPNQASYFPFYNQDGPKVEINFEELFEICSRRLCVLKRIDEAEEESKNSNRIYNLLMKTSFNFDNINSLSPTDIVNHDHISHFTLRLMFSSSKEESDWFVRQETKLFNYRLENFLRAKTDNSSKGKTDSSSKGKTEDLSPYIEPFKDQMQELDIEFEEVQNKPGYPYKVMKYIVLDNEICTKQVRFEYVPKLIATRNIAHLENGYAYLDGKTLIKNLFPLYFKENLKKTLELLRTRVPIILEQNEILNDLFQELKIQDFEENYVQKARNRKEKINISQLDSFSRKYYPLCMREMHRSLKENHHLKHFGRMQYGLFLKGIGISLEDSLKFWRNEFTKKMPLDKFEKNYAYNIRHSYGKEGKRLNYDPWSCETIIKGVSPGQGETHGCPFQHYSERNIKNILTFYQNENPKRISNNEIDGILEKRREKHYQVACKNFFKVLFPDVETNGVGIHPNGYFESALNFEINNKPKANEETSIKEEKSAIPNQFK